MSHSFHFSTYHSPLLCHDHGFPVFILTVVNPELMDPFHLMFVNFLIGGKLFYNAVCFCYTIDPFNLNSHLISLFGGLNSHLELDPISARDTQRDQAGLVRTGTWGPQGNWDKTVLERLLWRYGSEEGCCKDGAT